MCDTSRCCHGLSVTPCTVQRPVPQQHRRILSFQAAVRRHPPPRAPTPHAVHASLALVRTLHGPAVHSVTCFCHIGLPYTTDCSRAVRTIRCNCVPYMSYVRRWWTCPPGCSRWTCRTCTTGGWSRGRTRGTRGRWCCGCRRRRATTRPAGGWDGVSKTGRSCLCGRLVGGCGCRRRRATTRPVGGWGGLTKRASDFGLST